MSIVTNKKEVLDIYSEASRRRWVLPCFCSENLTTTEAILAGAKEYGEMIGESGLPVILAITNQYDHRTQAAYYTHTRRWDIGLKLFMKDIEVLTAKGAPYEKLRVMIHLDHTQFDTDKELLGWDMEQFSSIMFDASRLTFDENIKLTRDFVKAQGNKIVIEGACDEIVDATGNEKSEITSAEKAYEYFSGTGADMIVANLGTEHRASAKDLKYYGDSAKKIKERIGTRIVLHGTSSVPSDQVSSLFNDGVCKVNIWTALERDSSPALFADMAANASKVTGKATAQRLKEQGILGAKCNCEDNANLSYFTTTYRQNIVFEEMKKMAKNYFDLWMK
jgi:fructose/tagatose bisphosphate aldolase